MYCAQFIFKAGDRDEEYYRLHKAISEFCESVEGFVGVERWIALEGEVRNSAYYFDSLDAIKQLSTFSGHKAAKAQYQRWYDGYQIVVSEVLSVYGDKTIETVAAINK